MRPSRWVHALDDNDVEPWRTTALACRGRDATAGRALLPRPGTTASGTGLGLAIAHEAVEHFGGRLSSTAPAAGLPPSLLLKRDRGAERLAKIAVAILTLPLPSRSRQVTESHDFFLPGPQGAAGPRPDRHPGNVHAGQGLNNAGFTVHGVQLPGHCGTVDDLLATTWEQWYQGVEDAAASLRGSTSCSSEACRWARYWRWLLAPNGCPASAYGATFRYDGWNIPAVARLSFLLPWFKRFNIGRDRMFMEEPPYGLRDERRVCGQRHAVRRQRRGRPAGQPLTRCRDARPEQLDPPPPAPGHRTVPGDARPRRRRGQHGQRRTGDVAGQRPRRNWWCWKTATT